MKDLQNLRRVAEKVPNSRAIRLGDIHVFALPMSPPCQFQYFPLVFAGEHILLGSHACYPVVHRFVPTLEITLP